MTSTTVSIAASVRGRLRPQLLLLLGAFGLFGCSSNAHLLDPAAEPAAPASKVPLLDGHALFATVETTGRLLGAADDFSRTLSATDRTLRLGSNATSGVVDERAFLRHVERQGRPWSSAGHAALESTLGRFNTALAGAHLPLPAVVPLLRTSGLDEMGAHYTRGAAVVFASAPTKPSDRLLALLAHELFHVASRHDAEFRRAAYALIGAEILDAPVAVPLSLQARRVTNPDAPMRDAVVNVREKASGQALKVAPMLTLGRPAAEVIGDKHWFRHIRTHLVVVAPSPRSGQVIAPEATNYHQVMNRNTTYNIHPEEVLAVNFSHVVLRRAGVQVKLTDVGLVDALERLLLRHSWTR